MKSEIIIVISNLAFLLGKYIQKEISASVSSKWALKRHLRSCHTIEDLNQFEILVEKQKRNKEHGAIQDSNHTPSHENSTAKRKSIQNLKQEMSENMWNQNDIINTETNLELLKDVSDIESNNETFKNSYGDSVPPYTKSFEPLFTLKEQIGEKLRFKCNKCPEEKEISSTVKSNWGLKRHIQTSHTIGDLEEFEILNAKAKTAGKDQQGWRKN